MGSLWGNPIAYTKAFRPVVTYNKRAYSCKPPTRGHKILCPPVTTKEV
jgi:hypothetical protein